MKSPFQPVDGSLVAPRGYLAGGVFCDVKRLGTGKGSHRGPKRDLALVVSSVPAVAAGMFTTNQVCAAPVKLCVQHLRQSRAQAIIVNSGNANACTGPQGLADAREMASCTALQLLLHPTQVLVASTGRIGIKMPMARVRRGIRHLACQLDDTPAAAAPAAEAILTSDTRPKSLAVEFALGGKRVRIGGICKGAGMIQPGMSPTGARPAALPRGLHATMLCFLTTDVAIAPAPLRAALREAVAASFNRITVDGDMSTNDTVLILANGLAENKPPAMGGGDWKRFHAALHHVCHELALMIVRDGEGVHRVVTVRVQGARSDAQADAAARAVGNSALVKTSWHGGDPNWGRIMDALGYSKATIVESRVDIGYSAPGAREILFSLRKGQPTRATFRALCAAVAPREFDLHIHLNSGRGAAVLHACDLTESYVEFNKGDVGNLASLGG